MNTLVRWREAFEKLDSECPWPGPRPLSIDRERDRRELLVGRENDIRLFVEEVRGHSLVLLHGDSGVGKSSLLNVGLVDALDEQGFTTIVCWDWTNLASREGTPEELITDVLRQAPSIPEGIDLNKPGLLGQLDLEYEDHAVLVLDQFEELIRYRPERFRETVEWILEINRLYRVRVVLSLRSEYLHRLKDLEKGARPFSLSRYELEAIDRPEVITSIVLSANRVQHEAITQAAATCLTDVWRQLAPDSPDRGLLQLQAVLYALHARIKGHGRATVEDSDVTSMLAAGAGFPSGLDEAIALKLDRCTEACRSDGLDEFLDGVLIEGTRAIVRECIGHLSSGGFKLVRDEWNLAREALRRELAIIGLPTEGAESIFRALSSMTGVAGRPDFLTARRSEILEAASDLRPDGVSSPQQDRYPDLLDTANALAKFGVEPVPWISDPDDVSSGPMLGLSPRSVLVEELRRFAFAMEWLSTATLTRASTLAPGETMLTLIHDGFSRALSEWATKTEAGPARALAMLTAAEGERFNWRRPDAGTWGAFNGEGRIKRIINVRWRNCRITASLRRVVFVNCDLRGSRFVGCQFEGVVFVNCLLDNTTFSRCTITGTVSDPPPIDRVPADGDRQLPSFVVTADRDSVFALNRHRETVVSAAVLFSVTSGVAAVPWSGPTDGRLPYEDQLGGLTMYGGRLSSLMIQDCTFVDHGALSLRHIAGSSLDIVEQSHGTFEIFDSTIRGLSITKPVGDVGDSNSIVTIAINGCALADTWFGDGLRGRATIRGSVLWQLLSAGDPETFAVDVADCGYHGLVNVSSVAESSRSLPGFSLAAIVDRHDLVASATRMAYRARPAQLELERRAAAL